MPRKQSKPPTKRARKQTKPAVPDPSNELETPDVDVAEPLPDDDTGELTLVQRVMSGKRPAMVTLEQFQEFLRDYQPQAGLKIYVYRKEPTIDLRQIGMRNTNLQIRYAADGFPADIRLWIQSLYGGGKYKLKLNDSGLQFCGLVEVIFTIPLDEHEPILDVGALVRGDAANEALIQRWKLEGRCTEKDGKLYPGPGGTMSAPGQQTEVTEILREMRAAADPMKTIELIDKIRGEKQNDGITAVLEMLKDDRAAARAEVAELRRDNARLMEKLMDLQSKPATPAKTLVEQIDEVRTAHEKLECIFGRAPRPEKQSIWEKLLPMAVPMLEPVLMRALGDNQQPAPAAPGAQPGPQPVPIRPPAPTPETDARNRQAAAQLAELFYGSMQREVAAEDVAATVKTVYGPEAYNGLVEEGTEKLIEELKRSAPEVWAKIEPLDYQQYFDDFMHAYDDEEEEEEEAQS